MKFVIQRKPSDAVAVMGELFIDDQHECFTLEPSRDIPAGTYSLIVRWSPRHNRMLPHVENVPGFSEIEIHPGNFPKDTLGCTLVGTVEGKDFVGHSDEEFSPLFQKILYAVKSGPQVIRYFDPPQEVAV